MNVPFRPAVGSGQLGLLLALFFWMAALPATAGRPVLPSPPGTGSGLTPGMSVELSYCVIGADDLNFGNLDPASLNNSAFVLTATTAISVLCATSKIADTVQIGISLGSAPTGGPIGGARKMLGPSPSTSPPRDSLTYDVFQPSTMGIRLSQYSFFTPSYCGGDVAQEAWWGPLGGPGLQWPYLGSSISGAVGEPDINIIVVCGVLKAANQPKGLSLDPGSYTDTLTVTATYQTPQGAPQTVTATMPVQLTVVKP